MPNPLQNADPSQDTSGADPLVLPAYVSHKHVRAAPIRAAQRGDISARLVLWVGGADRVHYVDPAVVARYFPLPGDYLVVYEDGYQSISPKAAFETGYRPVEPPQEISHEAQNATQGRGEGGVGQS